MATKLDKKRMSDASQAVRQKQQPAAAKVNQKN